MAPQAVEPVLIDPKLVAVAVETEDRLVRSYNSPVGLYKEGKKRGDVLGAFLILYAVIEPAEIATDPIRPNLELPLAAGAALELGVVSREVFEGARAKALFFKFAVGVF